jgi:putative FmdB family regulatory protein
MPIYDYKCEKCNATRTVTLSIDAEEYKAICSCGETMVRVYAVAGVRFNGSGFYTTDKGK